MSITMQKRRVGGDGPSAEVVLKRPGMLNGLDEAALDALRTAFEDLAGGPEIRIVLLRGEGRAFCADAARARLISAFQQRREPIFTGH